MTASLQTKKDRPNYYVVLSYKDEITGKNKLKWVATDIPVKGNHKREAEERRKAILAEYEDQNIDLGKDVLFTVYMKEWLENHKHSISSVTYDTYRLIVHNQIIPFFEPKKLKLKDVTPSHIQQYMKFKLKTVSPNTVRKHLWDMSKCFESAVKQNMIAFNPVKRIEMPKNIRYTDAKFYNEKQIEQLLNVCKGDILEGIIQIVLFYGIRRSEAVGLKWDAIDLDNNVLTIKHTAIQMGTTLHKNDSTKNSSSYRSFPIPQFIKNILLSIRAEQLQNKLLQPNDYKDEGYVFTRVDGRLILPNYVTKHFKKLLIENNLPVIRFHDLRHSSAHYLKYLGFDLKDIQAWLGHSDIGTTMNIYVCLDLEAKKSIADNLNEKFMGFRQDFRQEKVF